MLAKSNMAEFAFSPIETVNSVLPGYTKNPYALDRVTAGSSGGTAAAVAADLGEVGLGHRHRQLDSRAQLAPGARRHSLDDGADEPRRHRAAQSVRRYRRPDGADRRRRGRGLSGRGRLRSRRSGDRGREGKADTRTIRPRSCATACKGARIGVLRQAFEGPTVDPEVRAVFERARATISASRGRDGARHRDHRRARTRFAARTAARAIRSSIEFNPWLAAAGRPTRPGARPSTRS